MFKIGEFSKIAQVSGRLLRYYDQIDLLKPAHTDPATGARYYSASQLPRLNRILALKELGLTLEQVGTLLDEDISTEEIRGMLIMKKAQVAQTLQEEFERLQHIESRIQQIDEDGTLKDYDVVVKEVPTQGYFALRHTFADLAEARALLGEVQRALPGAVKNRALGYLALVVYSEYYETENLDMAMGFLLNEPVEARLALGEGLVMTPQNLPGTQTMVSAIRVGGIEMSHISYSAIGVWVEENGYQFAGPGREVFLRNPLLGDEGEPVTEIQFPVKRATPAEFLLT